MNMIRHDHGCVQMNSRRRCGAGALAREWPKAALPQTMFKHKIASLVWQDQMRTSTESDE
jgi:hypothetical protein